jgi:hypothetical protein
MHMHKTWLLPIVSSYSAAPELGLVGHPWYIEKINIGVWSTKLFRVTATFV